MTLPLALRCAKALLAAALLAGTAAPALGAPAPASETRARSGLAGLRVPFIANHGQLDAGVAYYAPTFAGAALVTRAGEVVYRLPGPAGASPGPRAGTTLIETFPGGTVQPAGRARSATGVSSFAGRDRTRWQRNLPTYDEFGLGQVWPGVAVSLRAHGHTVEKIFTVAPGASADQIRVRVGGARGLRLAPDGALVARTGLGDVTFTAPVAYQERGGTRRAVPVAYRLHDGEYGFTVGPHDRRLPLVIDPLLQAAYLGGANQEQHVRLAIDPVSGDVYLAGTISTPTAWASSGFIARLNAELTTLHHLTVLGGPITLAAAVAVRNSPEGTSVYVAGVSTDPDFPETQNGAQPELQPDILGAGDAGFVARLNGDLTDILQATYLHEMKALDNVSGGGVISLALHPASGDVYVAGPVGNPDGFVARLNGDLEDLLGSTPLVGGRPQALAVLPASADVPEGAVYVAGLTDSEDFPLKPPDDPGFRSFVVRLNLALTSFEAAAFAGQGEQAAATALAIHPQTNDVYVAGIGPPPTPRSSHGRSRRSGHGLTLLLVSPTYVRATARRSARAGAPGCS